MALSQKIINFAAPGVCRICRASALGAMDQAHLLRCADCGAIHVRGPASAGTQLDRGPLRSWAPDGVLRGKYQVLRELGHGAHGTTYLAEHLFLNHPCVVKVLGHNTHASGAGSRQLLAEARAGFRVNHPNVVRVLDCDLHEQTWFFVMEYVDGVALSDIAGQMRLPWRQVQRLALDSLAGLHAIHCANIIHHDIKPGNLLLDSRQELRIADLGIARAARPAGRATPPPNTGTLNYAAPELFVAGASVDHRADLYSLGATLFELLAGAPPFPCTSMFELLLRQQNHAATWPDDLGEIPEWLRSAILRMLAVDPQDRFPTAQTAALAFTFDPPSSTRWRFPNHAISQPSGGVGLLPLAQINDDERFDWVGMALTDYLARAFAKSHGMYVVDAERLQSVIQPPLESARLVLELSRDRKPAPAGQRSPDAGALTERQLRAAAKVGASTVLTGEYEATEGGLHVTLRIFTSGRATSKGDALNDGSTARAHTINAHGRVDALADIQSDLLNKLELHLQLPVSGDRDTRPAPQAVTAQEFFARARQAFLKADYIRAIDFAEQALAIEPEYVEAIGLVGVCHARRGDYEDAEAHHGRILNLAQQRKEPRWAVEAHANLGVMYYFRSDYERAHEAYAKAAEQAAALRMHAEAAQINSNLGFVLYRLDRPTEAEQAFRRAIATHHRFGANLALIGPYNGLGNVLTDQGRYEEAREYYRRALELAQEMGDRANIGTSHMHLGHVAALEGRFSEAKTEFALAQNALEEVTFWNGLARLYEYMADMNLRLGQNSEAVRCADRRIELARQHNNKRIEAAAWRQKGHGLEALGQAVAAREAFATAEGM